MPSVISSTAHLAFRHLLRVLTRLLLGGTFLVAGILKLSDLAQAQTAVAGYHLVPATLLWPATLLLPWTELIGALGLFWDKTRPAALALLTFLLLVFLIAIISAWVRGIDLACGCFGGTGSANYPWLILRDLLLLALVYLSRGYDQRLTTKHPKAFTRSTKTSYP